MHVLLAFGLVLLAAVLISEIARTSILSTSVLVVVVAIALGRMGFDVFGIRIHMTDALGPAAEVALLTILFVDGAQLGVRDITGAWRLPGRALVLGLPLTIGALALAAHWLLALPWLVALLVGAVLSPTDPVMVRAVLRREHVPERLRSLLSIESGVNDGLALPIIMILLSLAQRHALSVIVPVAEALGGAAIGIAATWLVLWVSKLLARDRGQLPSPPSGSRWRW